MNLWKYRYIWYQWARNWMLNLILVLKIKYHYIIIIQNYHKRREISDFIWKYPYFEKMLYRVKVSRAEIWYLACSPDLVGPENAFELLGIIFYSYIEEWPSVRGESNRHRLNHSYFKVKVNQINWGFVKPPSQSHLLPLLPLCLFTLKRT